MIDLVLVSRDMLQYVQEAGVVRGLGQGLSDHYVVLCKVRLIEAWIKRREVVGARSIRSEKLREHQYRERYARSLEGKGVEWNGDNSVQQRMWWNDEIEAAIRRREGAWKGVLAASDEDTK